MMNSPLIKYCNSIAMSLGLRSRIMNERLSFRFETFIRDLFALFPSLKQRIHLKYSLLRISLIPSKLIVITNKILILSFLCKRRSSYFPAKNAHGWKD